MQYCHPLWAAEGPTRVHLNGLMFKVAKNSHGREECHHPSPRISTKECSGASKEATRNKEESLNQAIYCFHENPLQKTPLEKRERERDRVRERGNDNGCFFTCIFIKKESTTNVSLDICPPSPLRIKSPKIAIPHLPPLRVLTNIPCH